MWAEEGTTTTGIRYRLSVRHKVDPSDKDNMLWHNSDNSFLRLPIWHSKEGVSQKQNQTACKHMCGTLAGTYNTNAGTDSSCTYKIG